MNDQHLVESSVGFASLNPAASVNPVQRPSSLVVVLETDGESEGGHGLG